MKAFQVIVYILGAIAVVTGANDFWQGAVVEASFGQLNGGETNPTLNFTVRFFAAIWMGFGVLLALFAFDLKSYKTPLIVSFVVVIIGGLGRLASVLQYGIAEGNEVASYLIIGLELVLIPILLVWLVRLKPND